MRKQLSLLALLAAMLLPLGAGAQEELTVCDGTATNSYIPVWGLWLDNNNTHSQSIYPESMLSELDGSNIEQLTWYLSQAPSSAWPSTFTIRLMTTTASAYTSATYVETTGATAVYTGTLTVANNMMTVELDEPFTYNGGNLLVDFQSAAASLYSSCSFYGTTPSGITSIYGRGTNAPSTLTFLPKLTIVYTPASGTICRKPYNLQVSNITTSGADFTWNTRNGESSWQVYIDGEFAATVGDSSYTATGLSASSQHTFGVAAVCADGTSGIATTTFRTACDVVALPWGENFESYNANSQPDCWTMMQTYTQGNFTYPYVSASTYPTGARALCSNYTTTFATPQLDAESNQLHVVFWARTPGFTSARLQVGLMTDTADADTWRLVYNVPNNGNVWTEYEFYTDTVTLTGNPYIVFRYFCSSSAAVYIDDIDIEVASDCRRPESASVSLPTYEGATVRWTDNDTAATGYTVRVTKTNNVTDTSAIDMPFGSSPAVVTGLDANTTYYAWVAANCGSEQTMWRAAGSFTTQRDCYPVQNLAVADRNQTSAALTWTYQDGFGREATGVSIRIIDLSASPADTNYLTATGTSAFVTGLSGGHTYSISVTTQCDGNYEAYAAATTVTLETPSCGQLQGNTTNSYSPFNGNYKYGYSQTIYPASALQGLSEISGIKFRNTSTPSSVLNRIVNVYIANTDRTSLDTNDYVAVDELTQVAANAVVNVSTTGWKTITFSEPFTWDGTSNVVIAVQNVTGEYSSFYWGAHSATEGNTVYWYRDGQVISPANPNAPTTTGTSAPSRGKSANVPDIAFLGDCEMPSCLAPVAAFGSSTETTATIEWVAGNQETEWTVEYRLYGDTTWTTAEAGTSQTSATVSGLEPSTLYEFHVGSLCGNGTLYSPTFAGRTACGAISLPYTETFEGWNTGEFPACWFRTQEYVSSGSHYPYISSSAHSGTRAMYIYGGSATGMIASPAVPADADNIKVTFWAHSSYATPTNGCLKVGVLTNSADPSSFIECTAVATGISEGYWREYEFYTDNVTAAGPVHVAFKWQLTSSYNYGYLDDVAISEAGTCRKPNTPSRNNIGYYTATLHWNDVNHGGATYDVRYSTVNNVEADGYQTVTSTGDSVELTGLHNGTTYYAWVRPQCNTALDWLAIPSFTTLVSCYPVTGISLSGRTFATAALTWSYSSNGMAPQGTLLSLMDRADSTMVAEDVFVEGTSHIFTGLESGHSYTAYFMTLCNPDTSAATQFNFNIEMPNCGEQASNTGSTYLPFHGNYNYGYTQTIYPASLFAGSDTLFGISYQISSTPSSYPVRPIDVYIGTPGGRTSLDTNNFVPVSELTQVADNFLLDVSTTGWTTIMFDTPYALPADSNIVIAVVNRTGHYSSISWRGHTDESYAVYWYRDGTYIDPANPNSPYNNSTPSRGKTQTVPSIQIIGNCDLDNLCTAPIVILDSVSTTSVSLSWAADNCSQFTVEHRPTGADSWTTNSWTTDATDFGATSYTVGGLQPATSYEFRIGSQCSEDNTQYSLPLQTYTDCDAMTVPASFTFTQPLSPCWTLTNSNVYIDNSALYWTYDNNTGIAVLPELDQPVDTLMAVVRARYSYYSSGSPCRMVVGVGNAQGSNVTWIDTIDLTSSYADYYVYFNGYTGPENRIVISKLGGSTLYIESIEVYIDNNCLPMTSFGADTTTSNTANLVWSHQSATYFEVQYRIGGTDTWQSTMLSGTSGMLTGLQPSSTYQARIRAVCSATDSSLWSPTISFTTACGGGMPWSENFDTWTSFSGNCWMGMGAESYSDTPAGTPANSNYFWIVTSSYGNIAIEGKAITMNVFGPVRFWAITPEIEVNTNLAKLSFDIAADVWNSSSSTFDDDDRFVAAISTDGGSTYTPLYQLGADTSRDDGTLTDLSTDYTTVSVPVIGYSGQTVRFAFYGGSEATGGDNRLALDNISLTADSTQELEPCEAPTAVNVSNVGTTIATVSWTSTSDASQWQIELSAGGNVANTYNANANHYTLSGLSEGTAYSVRVRTMCTDGQTSDWSAAATFTTDTTGGSHQGIESAGMDAVSLWPNPASSVVRVGGLSAGTQLTVVDLNGRTVARFDIQETEFEFNVDNLVKGAYFVRIVSADGTAVRKLVVR